MTDIKELIRALRCSITVHTKKYEPDCMNCKYRLLERIDNNPVFSGAKPDAVIDGVHYFVICETDRMANDAICILEKLEAQPE